MLDLGRPDGRAVIVAPGGTWEIVDRSPVVFRRTELTSALPDPVCGGTLDELAELVNIADDDLALVIGFLLAALLADLPRPILLMTGEQGTGKTTAAKLLARIIDPSSAPTRAAPKDVEAWIIAAAGSQVVVLDNLTTIPEWLSDALCRAATGEGLVKRKLYSDNELSVTSFRRAVALTSIDAGALRGDLADRLLPVELVPLADTQRRTDEELNAVFAVAHPRILGALLDVLAAVLEVLPTVDVPDPPRMADFGRLLAAQRNAQFLRAFKESQS